MKCCTCEICLFVVNFSNVREGMALWKSLFSQLKINYSCRFVLQWKCYTQWKRTQSQKNRSNFWQLNLSPSLSLFLSLTFSLPAPIPLSIPHSFSNSLSQRGIKYMQISCVFQEIESSCYFEVIKAFALRCSFLKF